MRSISQARAKLRSSANSFTERKKVMRHREFRLFFMIAALSGLFMLAACSKKVAKATPPPPPAPPAPTATLAANPSVLQQGQSTTLTWQTTNANDITIPGLGTVAASGSRTITPSASTTYELSLIHI